MERRHGAIEQNKKTSLPVCKEEKKRDRELDSLQNPKAGP
jgi:hypothetical protein